MHTEDFAGLGRAPIPATTEFSEGVLVKVGQYSPLEIEKIELKDTHHVASPEMSALGMKDFHR